MTEVTQPSYDLSYAPELSVQPEHDAYSVEDLTLGDTLWADSRLVWLRSGLRKTHALMSAAKEDVKDANFGSSIPVIGTAVAAGVPITSAIATGATQGADRVRIVVQEAPPRAIEAMTNMDFSRPSSFAVAGIVAGSFAVWNFFAGEVLNHTAEMFPRTTEKFAETFPRITRAAENAIPQELRTFNEQRSLAHADEVITFDKGGVGTRLRRGLKRGLNGFSLGSTIYMGVSAVHGIPVRERTKINAEVSRDAAVFAMAPVAGGIGEAIRQAVVSGDVERAATILSWAENRTTWNWVAGGVIALTFGGNYLARKKVDSKLRNDEAEPPTAELAKDL